MQCGLLNCVRQSCAQVEGVDTDGSGQPGDVPVGSTEAALLLTGFAKACSSADVVVIKVDQRLDHAVSGVVVCSLLCHTFTCAGG